jgi:hypothetical protein
MYDQKKYYNSKEKKAEDVIINLVMAITTRNEVLEEVVVKEHEPSKGKGSYEWQDEKKFTQMMVDIVKELQKVKEST